MPTQNQTPLDKTIESSEEQNKHSEELVLAQALKELTNELKTYKIEVKKDYTFDFRFGDLSMTLKRWVFIATIVLGIILTIGNVYLYQYKEWCDYAQTVSMLPNSKVSVYEAVRKEIEIRAYRKLADQRERELKESKAVLSTLENNK